jgi:hypothetical protein
MFLQRDGADHLDLRRDYRPSGYKRSTETLALNGKHDATAFVLCRCIIGSSRHAGLQQLRR